MAKDYDHKAIEKKWQKEWAKSGIYRTPDSAPGKKNFYTLVELPYLSGDLHIGHWYAYAAPDAFARMKRMQGHNVLYPLGWDAFGLPAENAAIKRNINPADWIAESVQKMGAQIRTMGNSFDWDREINTSSPEYMRWTQWLFLKFYEKGIAYRGKGLVNWCPTDQTVLANEQVIDGKCERCGSVVVRKELEQWFMKITDYAERLLSDLEPLQWPDPIKESQRNWIGKSEGAEIQFAFQDAGKRPGPLSVDVFTTRPDTLFGATYIAVSPQLMEAWIQTGLPVSEDFKKHIKEMSAENAAAGHAGVKEKKGIKSEFSVINPANKNVIPVWVGNYVLGDYGTGALMGVPAYDERDREFAEAYHIPIVQAELVDSDEIVTKVGGKKKTTYKLRDWLISRQRYWGAPIPIVYDPEGKAHPIPEEHLPWLLPTDADMKPKGTSPLGSSKELLARTEKIFGKGWRPETDTMDGFVDNSWYFFRYLDPKNNKEFCSLEKQKAWMPIARYSGGAEHTTVHVLYSRFFTKALFDMGLSSEKEPYTVRMNRGIILAEDGRKMSKRWGNTINPDEQVENVGADSVRTYLSFIGPYNEVGSFPWSTNGLIGVRRFLERVAGLTDRVSDAALSESLAILLNQTVKKVGEDIESMKFNTAVSQLMILSNEFSKLDKVPRGAYETFLLLLAPFAPHLTEELWQELGHSTSVHLEPWPAFDPKKLQASAVTLAVQVAGKTKGTVSVPVGASQDEAEAIIRKHDKMAHYIPEKLSRTVYVEGRIINFIP